MAFYTHQFHKELLKNVKFETKFVEENTFMFAKCMDQSAKMCFKDWAIILREFEEQKKSQ